MAMPHELVRVLHRMEGKLVEAAKQVIEEQQHSQNAPRSQFKLAIEAAGQVEDLRLLQAFLAYQASRDKEVWGHNHNNSLFVQRVWSRLQSELQAYELKVQKEARDVWQQADAADKQAIHRMIAALFFAHIERAFQIWVAKDPQIRGFYFKTTPPEQAISQSGGKSDGVTL